VDDEALFYPFAPKRDLIDASSRIYDVNASAPVQNEADGGAEELCGFVRAACRILEAQRHRLLFKLRRPCRRGGDPIAGAGSC